MTTRIPHLEEHNGRLYLAAEDRLLFLRAGEIHNSSASSPEYMDEAVWGAIRPMHLNCVIAPVYWECVEPEEGRYDFSLADSLITRARGEGVRLVLLWFGLWKNGNSDYVPGWVKRDGARFARVLTAAGEQLRVDGRLYMTVSPLSEGAVEADARCFGRLMAHIAQTDGEQHTVVAVQVENEIGVLGADRDYSPAAREAFARPVPEALRKALGLEGASWEECFGAEANESFMAWHFASAVQRIAAAGKEAYPLPMYCNAWLKEAPRPAGEYPSGGPQPHMQRIWRAAAPAIDFYAPDIYLRAFRDTCEAYCALGNPLFIPETRRSADAVPFYLYALGQHGAICCAPFGVEDMLSAGEKPSPDMLRMLGISEEAFLSGPAAGQLLARAYARVEGMEALLAEAVPAGRTHGFLDQGENGINLPLQGCVLRVEYVKHPGTAEPLAGGLVIELGPEEAVVLAVSCEVGICAPGPETVEAERYEEGRFEGGEWHRGRILNGDERHRIRFGSEPRLIRFRIYTL